MTDQRYVVPKANWIFSFASWRRRKVQSVVLIGLVLWITCPVIAGEQHVTVDFRVFPGLAEMDGNWAALTVAHDGKVFTGLACHGCDGHLVMYDPKADHVTDLGNLTALAGADLFCDTRRVVVQLRPRGHERGLPWSSLDGLRSQSG